MGVRRPKRRGRYAPLSSSYFTDPAVIAIGLQAEVVYVRSLAFAAGSGTDGFLHDAHVRLLCRGVRGIRRTCEALTFYKLWVRDDPRGGYHIRSWHKWNPSEEDIAAGQGPARPVETGRSRGPKPRTGASDRYRSQSPADTDTDTDAVLAARPPPGPGRAANPPDLTAVRARLAQASAKYLAGGR
jgi:hypothetical protein